MYKKHKLIGLGKHKHIACTVRWHCRRKRKVEQFKKLSGLSFFRFLGKNDGFYAARAPPPFRFESISKRKGESRMAEREKYCIALNGQVFDVSRELYEAYPGRHSPGTMTTAYACIRHKKPAGRKRKAPGRDTPCGGSIPPSEKYPRPYRPVVGRNAMKPAGNYDTSMCMARQGAAGEYAPTFERERGRFL